MGNINDDYTSLFLEDLLIDRDFPEIRKFARENNVPIMNSQTKDHIIGILSILKPKSILEIGSAIGYSSLCFKKHTGADITTIELSKKMANIARSNFERYKEDINLINDDAMKALKDLNQGFDFVFIDANKSRYLDYFKMTSKLLNKGGVIIADNVLFRGEVCNDDIMERRKNTLVKRLRNFLAYITDLEDFHSSVVPIGDGFSLSVRR